MAFNLPDLPYGMDALAPHISEETLEFHYGKHHKTYVDKLNGLVDGKDLASKSLEDLIKTQSGGVFNSTNGGASWHELNSGLPNLAVKSLAIDPHTPAIIYAGTYGGGVFHMQQTTHRVYLPLVLRGPVEPGPRAGRQYSGRPLSAVHGAH